MRINPVMSVLAVLVGLIAFYGFYINSQSHPYLSSLAVCAAPFCMLFVLMGVSIKPGERGNIMFKIVTLISLLLTMMINIFLFINDARYEYYILYGAIIFVTMCIISYGIYKTKQ